MKPPVLVLLSQDGFGYLVPLLFHMNFRIAFSVAVKNVIVLLIEISLNLWITLGHTKL